MGRRTVLASTGIAFSAALAGCSELEDDTAAEDDDALENQEGDQDQDNGTDDFSEDEGLGGDNSSDDTDQDHDQDDEIQEEEQDQDQEEEQEDAEDDEPEDRPDVILLEEAEDHLDVLSHDLDSDGTGCDFYTELERTSSEDEYHISFDTKVTLYSDDGETIAKKSGPNVSRDDLGEGESRVYSVSFDDC